MSQYENPGLMDLADQCWSICEQALSRTLEYFRRAPKYRDAGWRSIDLARYLEGRVLDIGAGRAGYLRKNTPREGLLILMEGRVLDIGAGRAGYLRKNTPRRGFVNTNGSCLR